MVWKSLFQDIFLVLVYYTNTPRYHRIPLILILFLIFIFILLYSPHAQNGSKHASRDHTYDFFFLSGRNAWYFMHHHPIPILYVYETTDTYPGSIVFLFISSGPWQCRYYSQVVVALVFCASFLLLHALLRPVRSCFLVVKAQWHIYDSDDASQLELSLEYASLGKWTAVIRNELWGSMFPLSPPRLCEPFWLKYTLQNTFPFLVYAHHN